MASPIILVLVLICAGAALVRLRLRIVTLVFLAGVAVLYGLSEWLIATAPRVRGCAYLCSPREDMGVGLLFTSVGLLVGGSIVLGIAALVLSLIRWARALRHA